MLKNQQNFTSISSDGNLFDFDNMFRRVLKDRGISEEEFMNRMRQHVRLAFPAVTEAELAGICASHLVRVSSFDKFREAMDILGLDIAFVINTKPSPFPEAWNTHLRDTGMDTRVLRTLLGEKFFYLGQVISKKQDDLIRLPKFGHAALIETIATLTKYGLKLGTDTGKWYPPSGMSESGVPEIWDNHIDSLGLRELVRDKFLEARITHIGQLVRLSEQDIKRIPGFAGSVHYVDYVRERLQGIGLDLNTNTTGWSIPITQ